MHKKYKREIKLINYRLLTKKQIINKIITGNQAKRGLKKAQQNDF